VISALARRAWDDAEDLLVKLAPPMSADFAAVVASIVSALWKGASDFIWPALGFALAAILVRGWRGALGNAKSARGEIGTNLTLNIFDIIVITPMLAIALAIMGAWIEHAGLVLARPGVWANLNPWLTGLLAVFVGDFIGYWRHRLEHTAPLWPAHAVHHSDTAMTWTTIYRFHPINRFSTALIDTGVLALFGFPPEALALNNLVRHYYGMLDHVDAPWSFGPLGRLLVSPVMHRWHHIRDANGAGVNFATVFSIFDQAFGTYWAPGPCDVPLGVRDAIGQGAAAQLWHPFKVFRLWITGASGWGRTTSRAPGAQGRRLQPTGGGNE
jgi:sterol desaturase/sphingolipid hydroxylase (fatty acid hydroxylase superfamily)